MNIGKLSDYTIFSCSKSNIAGLFKINSTLLRAKIYKGVFQYPVQPHVPNGPVKYQKAFQTIRHNPAFFFDRSRRAMAPHRILDSIV